MKKDLRGKNRQSTSPVQYLRGYCEFYKLKFNLTRDVLIPRPETELLVDEVLKLVHGSQNHKLRTNNQLTILDLGTGSGNIAISIANNLPDVKIFATDISPKALEVAKQNAKFHKVLDKVFFLESDLLQDFKKSPDIIVTNLPYIPTARLMYLDPMVIDFEPKIALEGGSDGFELYRKLFSQMVNKNIIPKYLIGEIDYSHGELAGQEALKYFPKADVEVKNDLAKKQRILIIKF